MIFCLILFPLSAPFSISLNQLAAFIGVAAWLVHTHLCHSWKKVKLTLIIPVSLFLMACVLSVVTAVDSELSIRGMKNLLLVIVFFWVMNALAGARPQDLLIQLARTFKISKFRVTLEKRSPLLENVGPVNIITGILILAGALSAVLGIFQALTHWEGSWDRYAVHGSLSNIMTYAIILLLIGCLTLARILFDSRSSKVWLPAALGLIGLAMTLTLIRQSWLAFFVIAVLLLFIKNRILAVIPILLIPLILFIGPHTFTDRLKSIVDLQHHSNQERLLLWRAGWDIFKDYPLTGCGFNCLFVVADQYPQHPILQKYKHLHTNVAQLAIETGALGLGAWLSIWVVYFVQLIRRYRQGGPGAPQRWVALGSAAAVIAFLLSGMFENNFYDAEIIILMYFIMALPFASSSNAEPTPGQGRWKI